jgi:hypothetical protein
MLEFDASISSCKLPMQARGVPPSAVEDAKRDGHSGNKPGRTLHFGVDGVYGFRRAGYNGNPRKRPMIDKARQVRLMLGAIEDYQADLMSLQTLIWKLNGLLNIIDDQELSDELDANMCLLEEINAYTYADKDYNFESEGKPLVDRAVVEIGAKTEPYASRYSKSDQ